MQKQRASKLHDVRSKKYWEMILGGVGGGKIELLPAQEARLRRLNSVL